VLGLSQNRLPLRPTSHHHSYHTYCQNLRHPLIFLDNPRNKYLTISNYIPVHPINPVIACYICIRFQYIPCILPRDIPLKHLIWINYLHYMGGSWNAGYPFIAGWFISWKIPIKNGWWLGVPLWLRKPPIIVISPDHGRSMW
jgi:hypothetical protein